MRCFSLTFFCFLLLQNVYAQDSLKLWYSKPATQWTEAMPIGNGRIGAMVFGKTSEELIQLNESSLWSGGPKNDTPNLNAFKYLAPVREALFARQYHKGDSLLRFIQGNYTQSYLPMADLLLQQDFKSNAQPEKYRRELNIGNATTTTTFTINGVTYKREIFVSAPADVIILKLTASKPNALNFTVKTTSQLHYQNSAASATELVLQGKAPSYADPVYADIHQPNVGYDDSSGCGGMRFQVRLKALNTGGKVTTDTSGIHVSNATEVVLILSAATSFNGYDKCPDKDGKDENKLAQSYLQNAEKQTYTTLLAKHTQWYKGFFDRVKFTLKDTTATTYKQPANERLHAYSEGAYDPKLEALYFNFGRYLLISTSREGGVAATLQGLWNNELRPPWSSNYTININTQMNYWPSEPTNLAEAHQPMYTLIENLATKGADVAKIYYHMPGWVAHHNTDIWALANPVGNYGWGDPVWANFAMGGNWMSRDLWEHYNFSGDKNFLRDTAYPIMKGAAEFSMAWLVPNKDGYLVSAPSGSPENKFFDSARNEVGISVGTTMDISIIRDILMNTIEASEILGADEDFRKKMQDVKAKLLPFQIGKRGNIVEWSEDFEETEPHHRHVSHLYGLHPSTQISPLQTPELAAGARRVLELRGDAGTGWSLAWKINFWARLLDGNHAHTLVRALLHDASDGAGGTFPNFFDAHPPFQIDGNFGGTAGMAEMLLQSQLHEIHLLPALPDEWKEGSITGLKARGNYTVGISWSNHQLKSATIKPTFNGTCKIRTSVPVVVKNNAAIIGKKDGDYYVLSFEASAEKVYELVAVKQ